MKTLPVRIVTPEKVAWEGEALSVSVPAWNGGLGILPGHAPLLAQMREGVVHIREAASERLLAVSGGFVEVMNNRVSLFAETAELGEEIDAERARQAAEKAKHALQASPGQIMDEQAMAALRRAMIRLRVAGLAKFKDRTPSPHE